MTHHDDASTYADLLARLGAPGAGGVGDLRRTLDGHPGGPDRLPKLRNPRPSRGFVWWS
jgi:hypothetical protein